MLQGRYMEKNGTKKILSKDIILTEKIKSGAFVFHVVFKVFNLGFNSPQC